MSNLADRLSSPSADFAYAVVGDDAELLAAIRKRIDQLELSHEVVEALAGIPQGYISKILGTPPMKRVQLFTAFLLIQSLGLRVILEEDQDLAERLKHRWVKRKLARANKSAAEPHNARPAAP